MEENKVEIMFEGIRWNILDWNNRAEARAELNFRILEALS
jgi:hypothetical protein